VPTFKVTMRIPGDNSSCIPQAQGLGELTNLPSLPFRPIPETQRGSGSGLLVLTWTDLPAERPLLRCR
jgi:hypothetical protein